jgi:hypothetical protein
MAFMGENKKSLRAALRVVEGGISGTVPHGGARSAPSLTVAGATPADDSAQSGQVEASIGDDSAPGVEGQCVMCGADVARLYLWIDWGAGREAVCGRGCADALLDVLDAFLGRGRQR